MKQAFGEEHPDTLRSIDNLAGTYVCKTRLMERGRGTGSDGGRKNEAGIWRGAP